MTSEKEQFYIQHIAELEKQVAELLKVNAELADKVAKPSKNSSNSSKPPSLDIVKLTKTKQSDGQSRQGGQLGHKGINRPPFGPDQIDETITLYADSCDCGYLSQFDRVRHCRQQGLSAIETARILDCSLSLSRNA